jgi:hypothetical protein
VTRVERVIPSFSLSLSQLFSLFNYVILLFVFFVVAPHTREPYAIRSTDAWTD